MNSYDLPTSLTIGEVAYPIRYGWRAVMDIFAAFNDPDLDDEAKTDVMLRILYPDWQDIPFCYLKEAVEKACEFLDCGQRRENGHKPRLVDWEQDAAIILPAVNHANGGRDVRLDPNLHWWTFFGLYMSIEGGVFSTVLHIRQKKAKGQKLDKWEEEFCRDNKNLVEIRKTMTAEEKAAQAYFEKWLY